MPVLRKWRYSEIDNAEAENFFDCDEARRQVEIIHWYRSPTELERNVTLEMVATVKSRVGWCLLVFPPEQRFPRPVRRQRISVTDSPKTMKTIFLHRGLARLAEIESHPTEPCVEGSLNRNPTLPKGQLDTGRCSSGPDGLDHDERHRCDRACQNAVDVVPERGAGFLKCPTRDGHGLGRQTQAAGRRSTRSSRSAPM